ncbi:hypothetical protein [Agrococcus sp. HG114]|uniref:hypothetical protein n=1 Tax=Agrococcus sp. HG114 TaxID=2969757 RepID=UPI00215B31C3|nr:hypothetical protein [Agrococcus sp. HG114]MCR8670443.1 hypothetical protein [Agrococcus sp. HG114]
MTTQFEFRLLGAAAPAGELDADHLIAIAQSLKELATKLGRAETGGEPVGRPTSRTQRVAKLTIGLAPGSTRVLVRRAADVNALPFDVEEERAFDEKFEAIVSSIAADERRDWITDTLALAAEDLRAALEKAAPKVEFIVGGRLHEAFSTAATHSETWRLGDGAPVDESLTFVGRLRVVNLDTQRLQVTDDLGTKVTLPNVVNADRVGALLGQYVEVVGKPDRDARGKLIQLRDAVIEAASPLPAETGSREPLTLDAILQNAPGPGPGPLPGLTPEEADALLQAIGR